MLDKIKQRAQASPEGDACLRCWHKAFHHKGLGCTGSGLQWRWSRFLQLRCPCSQFESAREAIAWLVARLEEARAMLGEVPHAYKCSTYDFEEETLVEGQCDCHRVAIDRILRSEGSEGGNDD